MKTFETLVAERKKQLIQDNLDDLQEHLQNPDYQKKVYNFATKFGFSVDEINHAIQENLFLAACFAKDPSKQNFTEKLVAEVLGVEKLSPSGENCIRFDENGDIVSINKGNVSKSSDFYIDNRYYTQKYTNETGGAQDNQYKDVVDFLVKGSKKHLVGAIVDGVYWTSGHKAKLIEMFKDNPNVVITSVDELRGLKNEQRR